MKQRHTKLTRYEQNRMNRVAGEMVYGETRYTAIRTWREPSSGKRGYEYNKFEFAVFVLNPMDNYPHLGLWDYIGRVKCDNRENAILEAKKFIDNKGI